MKIRFSLQQSYFFAEGRREKSRPEMEGTKIQNFYFIFKKSFIAIPACLRIACNVPSGISPG
jgi:hypothetical protein